MLANEEVKLQTGLLTCIGKFSIVWGWDCRIFHTDDAIISGLVFLTVLLH